MARRSWGITPRCALGKWSIGLTLAMPILFYIGMSLARSVYRSVPAGETIPADILSRPALSLSMLAGMGVGIAAFITGLLAIIQRKERTLLVYLSTLIGALLVVYLVGEVLFPH